MNPQIPLVVAGCVFTFVAFMHLMRLVFNVTIIFGGIEIPQWASVVAMIVAGMLAVWMFVTAMG